MIVIASKACTRCKQTKQLDEFDRNPNSASRTTAMCKPCRREYGREFRKRPGQVERNRWAQLLLKFGVSQEQYNEMLRRQNGVCAICRQTCKLGRNLAVDHDHVTGRNRGLLCAMCNTAVGKLNDDPQLLDRAAAYLRTHSKEA